MNSPQADHPALAVLMFVQLHLPSTFDYCCSVFFSNQILKFTFIFQTCCVSSPHVTSFITADITPICLSLSPHSWTRGKYVWVLLCCAFNVLNWTLNSFEKVKAFNSAVKPLSDRHTSSVFSSFYSNKVWHICSVTLKENFSNVSTSLWWFPFPFLREPYGDAVLTTADQRRGKR